MHKTIYLILILGMGLLAACSSPSTGDSISGASNAQAGQAEPAQENSKTSRLQEDYSGALSVQGQLAAGTILLDETDLAIDETLASEIFPLWQALQSLANSDTAAAAEVDAVLNQIQDTMSPEQISAISDMALTEDSLTELFETGSLGFGPAGFGEGGGGTGDGFPGGGFSGGPEGGFSGGGFPGGPGGEGFPGAPGGGGFQGGPGVGPGGFQNQDPDAIATRQAEIAAEGGGSFQERALLGAVVRLLGTKSGEFQEDGPGQIFETVFGLIGEETGLTMEEIQDAVANGTTLAALVEAHDGDLEAVRQALIEVFGEMPNADDLDLKQMADQWLGLEQ